MGTFILCPLRDSRRVDLKICCQRCESTLDCQEFMETPREIIDDTYKKLGIDPPKQIEHTEPKVTKERKSKSPVKNLPALNKDEAKDLYEQALAIRGSIEKGFFELGGILQRMYIANYLYGHDSWRSFTTNDSLFKALNIGWRTASYLRSIYQRFTELGVKPEDCVDVGWSRLKEILPVVDKKNISTWIKEAKNKDISVEKLNIKVRLAQGKITQEEAEKSPEKILFTVYAEQKENINRALELAEKITESNKKSVQLDALAMEFRSTYEEVEEHFDKKRIVGGLMGRIEELLKVKISEVLDETGEVIYE